MQCFVHHEQAAIGICRHCNRGLCTACAREIDGCLACAGNSSCGDIVARTNATIRSSLAANEVNRGMGRYFLSLFFGAMGLLFTGFGLYDESRFALIMGVMFLVFAAIHAAYQRAWARREQQP